MLRLTLLASAPTEAQHLYRFAADEPIDPVPASIAERLLAALDARDQVRCGPERRCRETASALGLSATSTDPLRAWSAGVWGGRTLEWVATHDPEGLRAWQTDADAAPHGGEPLNALLARTAAWLDEQTAADGRWLVIADSSVVRAIVVNALGAPPASFWRLDVAPLSLSVVQYAGGQWRLRSLDQASVAT
jgi:broad specificity phosphatase PhoE